MDAPQISTLDAPEEVSTPPPQPRIADAPKPIQEKVYVLEDDEEDQLIDDDDEQPQSRRAVPPRPPTHDPTPIASTILAPPIVAPTQFIEEPATPGDTAATASKRQRKRAAPAPAVEDASPTKKKRIRTANKPSMEVERQEPSTHDNSGTTSAWRLDTPTPTMQILQEEIPAAPAPVKRRRGPNKSTLAAHAAAAAAAAALSTSGASAPPTMAAATPPPDGAVTAPRRRGRQPKPKPVQAEDTLSEHAFPIASYSDLTPEVSSYDFAARGPPTHVEQFRVPDDGEPIDPACLKAAPLRPIPHTTNAVAPASFVPWQAYTGPLERTGKQCRKWAEAKRTIKTIGGGVWYAGTWLGEQHTQVERMVPPPILMEPALSMPTSQKGTPKPPKVSKPRKPRIKKEPGTGLSSSAPTPPTNSNSTPVLTPGEPPRELELL